MEISPDQIVYWQWEWLRVNATLVSSWIVMLLLAGGSFAITRRVSSTIHLSRWQNGLEIVVTMLREQIEDASLQDADRYLPFIGTLFLFIVAGNILEIVPGLRSPSGSLSTTAALAAAVFVAVPVYGVANRGLKSYLRQYLQPSPLMLPFNLISELSRTLALAIRLFGNIASGTLVVAILLSLAPLVFPAIMQAFGLLIGIIQAYVFALLALVYIASAARAHDRRELDDQADGTSASITNDVPGRSTP